MTHRISRGANVGFARPLDDAVAMLCSLLGRRFGQSLKPALARLSQTEKHRPCQTRISNRPTELCKDSANVTGFSLTGANNIAKNNLGWESTGVVEMNSNVVDGGGNILRDPLFTDAMNRDYHVKDAEAAKYGVYAP